MSTNSSAYVCMCAFHCFYGHFFDQLKFALMKLKGAHNNKASWTRAEPSSESRTTEWSRRTDLRESQFKVFRARNKREGDRIES